MILRKLENADIMQLFRTVVREDFPENEIKPYDIVKALCDDGCYSGFGYYSGDVPAAYAILVDAGDGILLDYFAVSHAMRGNGTGSLFLKEMAEYYAGHKTMFIEVEDPDMSPDEEAENIRKRRISFYLKNGAVMTGVRSRLLDVDYRIMTYINTGLTDDEASEGYRRIYECIGKAIQVIGSERSGEEKKAFIIK